MLLIVLSFISCKKKFTTDSFHLLCTEATDFNKKKIPSFQVSTFIFLTFCIKFVQLGCTTINNRDAFGNVQDS